MTTSIVQRAVAFLQKRHPRALAMHSAAKLGAVGGEPQELWFVIVQDYQAGSKLRALVVPSSIPDDAIPLLISRAQENFARMDSDTEVKYGNVLRPHEPEISTVNMPFSPRLVFYSDSARSTQGAIAQACLDQGLFVEFIVEENMYDSVFISYGGPDEETVSAINDYLVSHGVKTWFFPKDAVPGEKLHRTMSDGVNSHSRVLLVCSEYSLGRPGVLNEIERVLEREAREGGSTVLIPVALDDFVYRDWAPSRRDLADQIRARVISKATRDESGKIDPAFLDRVRTALNRRTV